MTGDCLFFFRFFFVFFPKLPCSFTKESVVVFAMDSVLVLTDLIQDVMFRLSFLF